MSNETPLTIIGNLTGDPELRFTPSGAAVANFTIASTPRTYDRQASEWKDGETLFMRCAVWRDAAEHVAASLHRGDRVIASGKLKSRSYEAREGGQRTSIELDVDEIGASLRSADVEIRKANRDKPERGGWGEQPKDDPWATGGDSQQKGWGQ